MASSAWIDECFLTYFVVSLTNDMISITNHHAGYTVDSLSEWPDG